MDLIRMLVLLPLMALSQQQPAADTPAAQPPAAVKADGPATKPAAAITIAMAPEARALLDDMSKAYHDLSHLQLAGTLRVEIHIDGEKPEQHEVKFTSSFAAPNQFRQEVPNEVLIGSTGTDVYTFKAKDKNYTIATAPKERAALSEYPPDVMQSLSSQNLSLTLALASDPSGELLSDTSAVTKVADTQIDGTAYPTLKLAQEGQITTLVAFDPATHLIKQIQSDLTLALKKRRPDLTSAIVSTVYTDAKTTAPEAAVSYAWSPPAGAIDAAAAAMARAGENGIPDGSQLLGKPAPAFKLLGLDAGEVSLASDKGHVVIVEFWATWCEPCGIALPKLDAIAAAHKEDGLKVYAINQGEDAAKVKAFVASTKLSLPVLLDSDGKVSEVYGAEGIPYTVIIDTDGKVVKVFPGYNDKEPAEIEKIVKQLLHRTPT